MPNVEINITGGSYKSRSRSLSSQKTENLYPELVDNDSTKSKYILNSWPGTKSFGDAPGKDRGMIEFKGILYKVSGTSLYSVDRDGDHSLLGEIPGAGRCTLEGIGDNLIVVSGGRVWVYKSDPDINDLIYHSEFSITGQETAPTDVKFGDDGLKMYVIGSTNNTIYQYTLLNAYDVTTATYASKSMSVSGQETAAEAMSFKPDGSSVYVVGTGNANILQYDLTTPWDISTGSYASKSFSVTTQTSTPKALAFSSDGTKTYVIGSDDNVYQYKIATAWDMSNVSYESFTYSVNSQDALPKSIGFSPDGLNMIMLGDTNNNVYQYTLTTAFTAATASYASKSFSVGTEEGTPTGMFLNPNGREITVVGTTNATVYLYGVALAAPDWDISNMTYQSKSFDVSSQETAPSAVTFNDDGTKMYIIGATNDTVYQYNISTAYDPSTAVYASKSLSVASEETAPTGLRFNDDGLKLYIVGTANDTVYEYALSTAYDVSTGSYSSRSKSITTEETLPEGLDFSPDGLKMYIIGTANDTVYQYSLSTAYDVSTALYKSSLFAVTRNIESVEFSPTGNQMFTLSSYDDKIYQYVLNNYEVSTSVYSGKSLNVTLKENNPTGLAFNKDGSSAFIVGKTNDTVYRYTSTGEVTDSDLETPNAVAHLNNQAIYDGNGARFCTSDVGDATSINSVNFASAESSPDDIVRPYVFNQVLYLFGERSTEPWYNSGVGSPPFDRIEGGIIPVGLQALHSTAHNDSRLYFLGDDRRVYTLPAGEIRSDNALTHVFESYIVDDAIGLCYSFEGQNFYQLSFPTENKTWTYSESTNQWIELSSENGRYLGNSFARAYNKNLIADYRNGNIYELDIDTYDENGVSVTRTRDTGPIHGGLFGAPGKSLEMSRFELIMEVGTGLTAGQGSGPVVMLSFSDDGGKTYSTEMWGTIGKMGEYIYKVEWFALGSFLSRNIRVRISDPVLCSIHSASADIEVGI